MRNNWIIIILLLGILSACSSRTGPDEFTILKNPPLVVPPDYHLRPPGDESELKDAFTPQEIAKRALFGEQG